MREYVIDLKKFRKKSNQDFGSKAGNLAKLARHNFLIPKGFCISSKGFHLFLNQNHILDDIDIHHISVNEIDSISQAIKSGFFPKNLTDEILQIKEQLLSDTTLFAVRSSGSMEDSATLSCAGQYNTFLNIEVENLFEVIKKCWASFISTRVIKYLKYKKLSIKKLCGGVIVQEMVNPEISGVLFTKNPLNNNENEIFLEIVPGLCEALVSGIKTPAQLIIDKHSSKILQRQFPTDDFSVLFDKNIIDKLLYNAKKIEKLFKKPQDIEWSYADENIFILQSRPIITQSRKQTQKIIEWTDENVAEVIPDVVTPLTWSILEPITNGGFSWLLKHIGISKYPPEGLFGLIKGKVYLNRTNFQSTLERFYFRKRLAKIKLKYTKRKKQILNIINDIVQLAWSGINVLYLLIVLTQKIRKYLQQYPFHIEKLKSTSKNQLIEKCDKILNINQKCMNLHIACTIFGELFYQILQKFIGDWNLKTDLVTVNNLLLSLTEAESAQSGIELWKIANKISEHEQIRKIFKETSHDHIEQKLSIKKDSFNIIKMIDEFIDKYGHSSLHEFELLFPRWREDRSYIYYNLKNYLDSIQEFDLHEQRKNNIKKREQATIQCLSAISSPVKKIIFKFVLRNAKRYSIDRENLKQAFVKAHSLLKQYFTQIAEELTNYHILKQVDDIFFITYKDIQKISLNLKSNGELNKTISRNKKDREEFLKISHPKLIRQVDDYFDWEVTGNNNNKKLVKGIGCSDGKVQARACVINNPDDFNELKKGEILIAPSTNPGWTPLFVLAAGVISEVGGALSHGSIIAREYGIPMVANIENATQIIKTGDIITIDGNSGTVKISNEQTTI